MIGRVYLLRGAPVMVLARASWQKGTPRNVLILLADGSQTVRPFRGLRGLP
jgi:acetyl esterase